MRKYWEKAKDRDAQLGCRIPHQLKRNLEHLARIWTIQNRADAIEDGIDPRAVGEKSVADVVNRLLEVGIEGWLAEVGERFFPETEDEWKALEKKITNSHKFAR